MSPLTLDAPAKLNLSLRVIGKRDDGFHEIDTVMVKLPGLTDQLTFESSSSFSFTCDDPTLPTDESNLVVKAVRSYEAASGKACHFTVSLKKSIPHGAGLAGGSSDAATTLLGLDQLSDHPLGHARLHEIAASLGSDIPFFLSPGAARCTGRGEKTEPIPSPPPLRVLLLKPEFAVSTPDAYRHWSASTEIAGIHYSPQRIEETTLINDLERPTFYKHRVLAELKQWLLDRRETTAALLCGSGATVFAVLRDDTDAEALANSARREFDPRLWHWSGKTGE